MRIALVHDDFVQAGGAESLFAAIASIWPQAPIYTSLVNWKKLPSSIDPRRIRVSWMQKIPFAAKFYKLLLPLYPLVFENFDFGDFDVVLSSTTRFAKSIVTKPGTVHICYINSLPRFLYDDSAKRDYVPKIFRIVTKPIFWWLARWDKASSSRVDHYLANSKNVKEDVEGECGFKSQIINPFADLNFFKPPKVHNWKLKSQNYFLIVTRLVKWKKVDIAIETFAKLDMNLMIIGEGPDKRRLTKIARIAKNRVKFLGRVSPVELKGLYQNAKALIVTGEEDFGIATVEAQACGIGVIAYKKGGQTEIINEVKTGIFFDKQSVESLEGAILASSKIKWSVSACRKNSLRFSQAAFVNELKNRVNFYASKS